MRRARTLARRAWDSEPFSLIVIYPCGVGAGAESWQAMFGTLVLLGLMRIRDAIDGATAPEPTVVTLDLRSKEEARDGD